MTSFLQQYHHSSGQFSSPSLKIREVWSDNLESELGQIRLLIDKYPFVSLDTEFPGFWMVQDDSQDKHPYTIVKANVEAFKLIQVGISLGDG